jgi:hypothetical protein
MSDKIIMLITKIITIFIGLTFFYFLIVNLGAAMSGAPMIVLLVGAVAAWAYYAKDKGV